MGVSGMKCLAEVLKTNTGIQQLSMYRNIIDVDGARALGEALKKNKTLTFIDIGHNRIRMTGLKSIVDGIVANKESKVSELGIKWNFISDDAFTYLFEKLVFPVEGRPQQLTKIWMKNNFLSEYHKVELHKLMTAANIGFRVYVDDFEGVNLLAKMFIDRSIWISPMPESFAHRKTDVINRMLRDSCGFIVDIRMGKGRKIPGKGKANHFCVIEFAHENSVLRSLRLASKKLAKFANQPVRIYKAGTRTAVHFPSQRQYGK